MSRILVAVAKLTFISINLLESNVVHTPTFCEPIDKLFDILNRGSVMSQNLKKFRNTLTSDQAPRRTKKCREQIEFLRTMLD